MEEWGSFESSSSESAEENDQEIDEFNKKTSNNFTQKMPQQSIFIKTPLNFPLDQQNVFYFHVF